MVAEPWATSAAGRAGLMAYRAMAGTRNHRNRYRRHQAHGGNAALHPIGGGELEDVEVGHVGSEEWIAGRGRRKGGRGGCGLPDEAPLPAGGRRGRGAEVTRRANGTERKVDRGAAGERRFADADLVVIRVRHVDVSGTVDRQTVDASETCAAAGSLRAALTACAAHGHHVSRRGGRLHRVAP